MKASMSTRGCPAVPSTLMVSLWKPEAPCTTSTMCALLVELAWVLIVVAGADPSLTDAEPRVGPSVDTHATWKPWNDNVAVAPDLVANSTFPPLAPDSVCRLQPDEYLMALAFSWNFDSLY